MRSQRKAGLLSLAFAVILSGCGDLLGSDGDASPGTLDGFSPAAGESGVSVLTSVDAEFSKKLNSTTLTEGVGLWDGSRLLMAQRLLTNADRSVVLNATDPLDFGTTYRVEVSPGLGFKGGAAFGQAASWEFTTAGLPPPVPNQALLLSNLEILADDTMRGRGSGSVDELKAAQYLSEQFMAYGLQEPPGGVIQAFSAFSNRLDDFLVSSNVLATVEGSGALADEWVVVGAHYDHIGYRSLPDETQGPNNGADDNGSGTVTVLEMGRLFKEYVDAGGMASQDRRSVLFALFGAEEHGLLGSCNLVYGSAAVPQSQIKAMMNFDMVGRLRDNTVYISGAETSNGWTDLVNNANGPALALSIRESSCTGCTDHVCFWQAGIPFVGFYTGTHDQYHRPEDDVALINFPGLARVGELGLRILTRLAVMPDSPVLTGRYPEGQ